MALAAVGWAAGLPEHRIKAKKKIEKKSKRSCCKHCGGSIPSFYRFCTERGAVLKDKGVALGGQLHS